MTGWLSRFLSRFLPPPPVIRPHEDVVFVDVRSRPEFRAGHARGAIHIPYNQMDQRWNELEQHRDQRILVYCLSGTRARSAARVLRDRGFRRAENAGGIRGLRRAGVDIERGA